MLSASTLQFLFQLAKGISRQFGPNCEVVVHDLDSNDPNSSIVAIENGHVSGRKIGDGPSHVVLEQIGHDDDQVSDQLCYLTRTKDGKTLKSSSVYIHDEHGKVAAILGINYDISMMQMFENTLHEFNSVDAQTGFGKGGTWSGSLDNLQHEYSPLFVFDDKSEGARALCARGATPVQALTSLQALTPAQLSFDMQ